jgi:hypothetical protein
MRTHLRVTAAALVFVGLTAGCSRTTEGSVAMTTEPGPPISAPTRSPSTSDPGFPGIPGLPSIPGLPQIPGLPGMPGNTNVPEVPAPANFDTMKCSEFTKLDEATQRAVVKAILEQQGGQQGQGPESEMVASLLASTMCSFLPSAVVKEVVLGGSPP